jgi:hypothetical protein
MLGWAFVVICVFYAVATAFQQYFILTDAVYFNSLGEQLAYERIEEMLNAQKSKAWLTYALIPVVVLIQIFLIVICLNVGTLLTVKEKIKFKQLFSIVTNVMVIPAFFKILMIASVYFFYDIKSFDDLANTFSFSMANFFDLKALPVWLQYPLATINLVELIFWLLLAKGIQFLLKMNFSQSFSFVSCTYGVGLMMWILLIVFLQVNFLE